MLVSTTNFFNVLELFQSPGYYALDTETSGLKESDRLFSIAVSNGEKSFYFNFWPCPERPDMMLPREYLKHFKSILENEASTWYLCDAKFDMRMLWYEGLEIKGTTWCIQAQERVLFNNLFPAETAYSLSSMAERRGLKKDDAVEAYVTKNKLFTLEVVPGKKQPAKLKKFYEVPLQIISDYAAHDAFITYKIGEDQHRLFHERATKTLPGQPSPWFIAKNESKLTKSLFQMERRGIKVDVEYTKKALEFELCEAEKAKSEFFGATGIPFVDGRTCLVKAFTQLAEPYPTTAKGNPSFTEEVLEGMTTPVASMVNKIRKHTKRANTYYSSFLFYKDDQDLIHANYRQGGTETGRFSCWEPNLQNVPKENEEQPEFPVRGCFIPSGPDRCLVSLDFDQMEYRVMLDYAGEMEMIEAVNSGVDVHQATADLVGITRKQAKTLNFAILYGSGAEKLSEMLGISYTDAASMRAKYFSKLPNVQKFVQNVIFTGRNRGYIWNYFGRVLNLSSHEMAYVLPNHIIQGSCGDIMRMAITKMDPFFSDHIFMVANIHDEVLLDVHKDAFYLIPEIKSIMETVYIPKNGLKLTVGGDHSFLSWAHRDFKKGLP